MRRFPLVLVADDFADTREMYAEYLAAAGFRTETAEDGAEAIAKARALRPDVVVLDMTMPNVDGWEAARVLRADPSTQRIVIIAVTGHVLPEHGKSAYEAGCDEYLTKPLSPDALRVAVVRALSSTDGETKTGRHPRRPED